MDYESRAINATVDAVMLSIILALGLALGGDHLAWLLGGYIIGTVWVAVRNARRIRR